MNRIEIVHNPFTLDTTFRINGSQPAESCRLWNFKSRRLQFWVDGLFEELGNLFNGDQRYSIAFTGVESDYEDLRAAAEAAEARGAQVDLQWTRVPSAVDRIETIRTLVDEARHHPRIGAFMGKDEEATRLLKQALDAEFDVCVVATMSSGKSTLINAMLGRDLLPSANEATTATITRIVHCKASQGYTARRLNDAGQEIEWTAIADLDTIRRWNHLADSRCIQIEGDVVGLRARPDVRVVVTDTPGPNNSQDERHQLATLKYVQDDRREPFIVYVLNGTQLATNDDASLLQVVAKQMRARGRQGKDRFIFVVNKMDTFDSEKEDIAGALRKVQEHLACNGIMEPRIFPISANIARLLRLPESEHSRKDRATLREASDLFHEVPAMDLQQYMPLNERLHARLSEGAAGGLLLKTGVPALEAVIDDYIDKYNVTSCIHQAHEALLRILKTAADELRIEEQLRSGRNSVEEIDREIEQLRARGRLDFQELARKMRAERVALPAETAARLTELGQVPVKLVRQLASTFRDEADPQAAQKQIKQAQEALKHEYLVLHNDYELTFERCQDLISEALHRAYREFLADTFAIDDGLEVPLVRGAMTRLGELSVDLQVKPEHVRSRAVVVGWKTVSVSSWYKPWTWGDTERVAIEAEQKTIDLAAFWATHSINVDSRFEKLVRTVQHDIEARSAAMTDMFIDRMSTLFDESYGDIMAAVSRSINERKDRAAREQAVREVEDLQGWMLDFGKRLATCVEVAHA